MPLFFLRPLHLLCLVMILLASTVPAFADEAQEVSVLLKTGQLDAAARRIDAFLTAKPQDVEMRFLKGVILTRQGKSGDAIAVFLQLTQDFPELPEPYNNLAVLYAAQGQYDKARATLEMAIRANPNNVVAHENLGDVYARLARRAYEKSLSLDANNASVQGKLALIRDLDKSNRKPSAAVSSAATSAAKK